MTRTSAPRVKRPRHLFFELEDRQVVELGALLRGEVKLAPQTEFKAFSLLTAARVTVSLAEIELLQATPRDHWLEIDQLISQSGIEPALGKYSSERLVEAGLLLSDRAEPEQQDLRRHDRQLEAAGWPALAALFHFMNRWQDRDLGVPHDPQQQAALTRDSSVRFDQLAEARGAPPEAFFKPTNAGPLQPLPPAERQAPLFELLSKRRTTRRFDPRRALRQQDLATLLYHVFGSLGSTRLSEELEVLHKSSPSGGALHPIEAYPLIRDVEGLAPGFYHYDVRDHGLSLIRPLTTTQVTELADRLTAGQSYYREAQLMVALTARFQRNFWKYGDNAKTYSVILMDAAHLSQTFYLVAAELGLGAFFSAAINGANLEGELELDPALEGAIAICGCGVPAAEDDPRPSLGLHPDPPPSNT